MLVTPGSKKDTLFSQQLQFYNKNFEMFGEIWVVDAENMTQ